MFYSIRKRILCALLTVAMTFSAAPANILADQNDYSGIVQNYLNNNVDFDFEVENVPQQHSELDAFAADETYIPIPGDILEITPGGNFPFTVDENGTVVFDMGDWEPYAPPGTTIPLLIRRPKGAEAGYPVRAWVRCFGGSDNRYTSVVNILGEYVDCIEFPPHTEWQTIYLRYVDSNQATDRSTGTISNFIEFYDFDRTTINTPLIKFTQTKSASESIAGTPSIGYASVYNILSPVKPGGNMLLGLEFRGGRSYFSGAAYCEVTEDLTLTLEKGGVMQHLKPNEPIGSITNRLTFTCPVGEDNLTVGWGIVDISGVKNAVDGSVVSLTHNDDYTVSEIDGLYGDYPSEQVKIRPDYGPITTDKEIYKGSEKINVTVPIQNADLITQAFSESSHYYGWRYDIDILNNWFSLSLDGGRSFVSPSLISWDEASGSIKASFPAPVNSTGGDMRVCVEVYETVGMEQFASERIAGESQLAVEAFAGNLSFLRAIYGANKIIQVSSDSADVVPVDSITITGLPDSNIIRGNYWESNCSLTVQVNPEEATYSGYSWISSNERVAYVSADDVLVFIGSGRTTISLISDEADYRRENGLPDNDGALVKSFMFYVGDFEARLITSSAYTNLSNDNTSVTAYFYDNFDIQEGEWDGAELTYSIRDAAGTERTSGTAERDGFFTPVALNFGENMPKVVSGFTGGEYSPAYTITLTANNGEQTISASSGVYIIPPNIKINCLTEFYRAEAGQELPFDFKIGNLIPGYEAGYVIRNYGNDEVMASGDLDFTEEVGANGLIELTGQIMFQTPAQTEASRFYTVTVQAKNPADARPIIYERTVYILNTDGSLINLSFRDGLGGELPITGILNGARESRVAELAAGNSYDSKEAFEYLDSMTRPQTLTSEAPQEWGLTSVTTENGTRPVIDSVRLYPNEEGKLTTLSWANVPTAMQFLYERDNLAGKVFVFNLVNADNGKPVNFIYENGMGQKLDKTVTLYNGYAVIYEPTGMKNVRIIQEIDATSSIRVSVESPKSVENGNSLLNISALSSQNIYATQSDSCLNANTLTMTANPAARFQIPGSFDAAHINYGVVDSDLNFIPGTDGRIEVPTGTGYFELPFGDLYKNPGSKIMVESIQLYSLDGNYYLLKPIQIYFFDLPQLERMWGNNVLTTLAEERHDFIKSATLIEPETRTDLKGLLPSDFVLFKNENTRLELLYTTEGFDPLVLNLHRDFPNSDVVRLSPSNVYGFKNHTFLEGSHQLYTFKPGLSMENGSSARLRASSGGKTVNLPWLIFQDSEAIAKEKEVAEIAKREVGIADGQKGMNLENVNIKANAGGSNNITDVLSDFGIDMPIPGSPFTFEVKKQGNEYIIKGAASYNFLPGGPILDLAGSASDFESVFNSCMNTVKPKLGKGEITLDFGLPSAFAGIRGYMIGKAVINPKTGDVDISFVEGGLLAELSGSFSGHFSFVIGNCGFKVSGLLSTGFFVAAPSGSTANAASPVKMDFGVENRLKVSVTVYLGVGVDVWIASATAGIEGSSSVDFRQKALYRPYMANELDRVQAGFKTDLAASLRGYLRFSFLWWTWKEYHDIWKGNWVYLTPDNSSNPYYGSSRMKSLSASYMDLINAPSDALVTGIDTTAAARYINNGGSVVYKDIGLVDEFTDDSLKTFDTAEPDYSWDIDYWSRDPAFGFDSTSALNGNAIAAWETFNDRFDHDSVMSLDDNGLMKHVAGMTEIRAGVYNGTEWSFTTLTDNGMTDISPRTATNGANGIVVWTRGFLNGFSTDSGAPSIDMDERGLVFALYDGNGWSKVLPLFSAAGGKIVDYAAAMDDDGSALVSAVTEGGNVYIISVSPDGEVSVVDNAISKSSRANIVFNGETYALACFDADNSVLELNRLDKDGYIMATSFSGIPEGVGNDFRLFRDRSASGMGTVVLAWPETKADDNGRLTTQMKAARLLENDESILVSAPIVAATEHNGAAVASYDAYVSGNSIKILTVYGGSDGSAYLSESQALFSNTIEARPDANDIYGLMPGIQSDFGFTVKNNGFSPIKSVKAKINGGREVSVDVNVLPNGETSVSCPYIPERALPESLEYSIAALFIDGSESKVNGAIDCRQADIAVSGKTLEQKNGLWSLTAMVSNEGPFSLEGKTVAVGLYEDALGTNAVCDELTFEGSDFETSVDGALLGSSVNAVFNFESDNNHPILYIVARAYDQFEEIPDRSFENNLLSVSMPMGAAEETQNISIDDRLVINLETWPETDSEMFDPKFSLTTKEAIDLSLFVAAYDEKGRLIRISSQGISLEQGEKTSLQTGIPRTDGASYKFFIWDSDFIPLTQITSF